MTEKQLKAAKPGEILEYIRRKIREYHSDKVENASTVYASHGYYSVKLPDWPYVWNVQRGGIPSLIRHIKFDGK